MTGDEIAAFLATQARAVVVAVDGDAPVGTVASVALADDGWHVTLHADDDVARLVAADDRVCVVVDQFPTYYEIKGVAAHGRATRQSLDGGRLSFTLALDDVTSFDFGKLPHAGDGTGAPVRP
jgi:hypothetical protein